MDFSLRIFNKEIFRGCGKKRLSKTLLLLLLYWFQMELPSSSTDALQASQMGEDLPLDDDVPDFISPDQVADHLITLSLVANSR